MEQISGKRIPLAEEANMQSAVVKRSIVISGHKTSVSLEDAFWRGLKEIGKSQHMTLSNLVADIDERRLHGNLSSSIRLFVLDHFRAQIPGLPSAAAGKTAPQSPRNARPIQQTNGSTGEQR
jgi:predicted DNA-binding ribbon-helix-helix protein